MWFPVPIPDVEAIVNNASSAGQVESASVSASGDSYSSVQVVNTVNTGGQSGSSVDVYTNVDGKETHQTYSSNDGESIDISTSTPNTHIEVHTSATGSVASSTRNAATASPWRQESPVGSSTGSTSPLVPNLLSHAKGFGAFVVQSVFGFFGSVFGIFGK